MPELNDNDLRKLFRTAGRPEPRIDLTDRIMARVAVTRIHAPLEVKPLIGRWGWVAIIAGAVGMIVLLMKVTGAGGAGASILDPLWRNLPSTEGFRISTGPWMMWAAVAAGCVLIYSLIDRAVEKVIR